MWDFTGDYLKLPRKAADPAGESFLCYPGRLPSAPWHSGACIQATSQRMGSPAPPSLLA